MNAAWKIVFPSIVKEDVYALAARRRVKLGL